MTIHIVDKPECIPNSSIGLHPMGGLSVWHYMAYKNAFGRIYRLGSHYIGKAPIAPYVYAFDDDGVCTEQQFFKGLWERCGTMDPVLDEWILGYVLGGV